MSLFWGVRAFRMDLNADPERSIQDAIHTLKEQKLVQAGDLLIFICQVQTTNGRNDSIQPRRVT
jgi:pyruvate kinase